MPKFHHIGHSSPGNIPAFRGPAIQKGYGIGGLFKGFVRTITPTIKRGLITAGKQALKTGIDVLDDHAQGVDMKTAIEKRVKRNGTKFIKELIPIKTTVTAKSKRSRDLASKKGRVPARKKPKLNDIFS